jgi:hypothetical protein
MSNKTKDECTIDARCPEHRKPLIEFFTCIPEHDVITIYNVLDLAHRNLIYESSDENLLMQEFMVNLFIAAKAQKIVR